MKTVIRIILIITFLQSCSKNNINSDLLGNWKSTKSANVVELNFFKDSLVSRAYEKTTKFSWKSDGTKIYYTQLTNINLELETNFILEYKFNSEKDTLYLKNSESEFTNEFIKISAD